MEFCIGETLRKWIVERNDHPKKYPNRRQESADIIKQVLEAVKYIHANQLFHRDLKVGYSPKNHSKANTEGKLAYRAQFPERANFHSIKEMNHFSIIIHNATSDCNLQATHKLFLHMNQPLNIMFGHEGCVKVADFGLVSREEKDEDGHLLERTQQTGTFSYMSPEQVCHLFTKYNSIRRLIRIISITVQYAV